jgi:hypothetical protein
MRRKVRNVNVLVPDRIYLQARKLAAAHRVSVTNLVVYGLQLLPYRLENATRQPHRRVHYRSPLGLHSVTVAIPEDLHFRTQLLAIRFDTTISFFVQHVIWSLPRIVSDTKFPMGGHPYPAIQTLPIDPTPAPLTPPRTAVKSYFPFALNPSKSRPNQQTSAQQASNSPCNPKNPPQPEQTNALPDTSTTPVTVTANL